MFDDCGDGSDEEDCSMGEGETRVPAWAGAGRDGEPKPRPRLTVSADPKLTSCATNASISGDEARCVRTEKAAYCACRTGFHTVPGQPGCQGRKGESKRRAEAPRRETLPDPGV